MSSLNESIKTIKTKPEYLKDIGVVGCLVMRHKVKGKGLYKIGGSYDSNFPRGLLTMTIKSDQSFPCVLLSPPASSRELIGATPTRIYLEFNLYFKSSKVAPNFKLLFPGSE